MPEQESGHEENHAGARAARTVDDLVATYLDRLNSGETIDPFVIISDHPDVGDEILEKLETFVELTREPAEKAPLGTLGDYTLRRQIGRGGMGVVYEARENSLDRRVALKVLPPGIAADARSSTRFLREAQIAAKLSHPQIVPVHATGIKDNTPWYAMEFVEGETLAQILGKVKDAEPETETPFGPKDQVDYFGQLARAFADVADGLQHAHQKGVTHRDIKPSNLILDQDSRLRILDFGLARLEGQESLTISGDFVGTPLYMSPEQARRKKTPVDHRTDVYSLGATMYEAICGQPPFRGKDHQDTLSQVIDRDPAEPRRVHQRIPRELETIVLKCLRKDPGDRYGTAEALGQDLRRFVRGDPIEARPQGRWEKFVRKIRRYRVRVAGACAILCVLGALGWLLHLNQLAEDEANRARYDEVILEAIKTLHGRELAHSGVRLRLGAFLFAMEAENPLNEESAEGSMLRILRTIADAAPERAEAPFYLARFLFRRGDEEEARRWIERTLEIAQEFAPARLFAERLSGGARGSLQEAIERLLPDFPGEESWQRQWLLAQHYSLAGKSGEAAKAYGRLITQVNRERGEPLPAGLRLEAHLGRGLERLELKQYNSAIRDFQAASVLCGRFLEATLLLASAYSQRGDTEEAENVCEEFYQSAALKNRSRVAFLVSCARVIKGRWGERLDPFDRKRLECSKLWFAGEMERVYEVAAELLTRDRNDFFGLVYGGLSLSHLQMDRGGPHWDAARAELLEIARRAADVYPNSTVALSLLSASLRANRDADGALRAAERALETSQRLGVHPAAGHIVMAQALLERGEFEDAEKHARAALSHSPGHWLWRLISAIVLESAGDYEEAAEEYNQLARGRRAWALKGWPLGRLAGVLVELGQYEEAERVAREATEHLPRNNRGFENLALALWKAGHLDDALEATAEGIDRLPDRTRLHRIRAEILEETGDLRGAAAALLHVLYLDASDEESLTQLQKMLDQNITVPAQELKDLEDRLKEQIEIKGPQGLAAQKALDWLRGRKDKGLSGPTEER